MRFRVKSEKEKGITYIELMIAIVVILILMTASILVLRDNIMAMRVNSAVGIVKNQIRAVRAEAIHKGTNQTIQFVPDGQKMVINGQEEIPLPKGIRFNNIH